MEKIIFERLTSVEMPSRAHSTDAGIDFYIPYDLDYVIKNGKNINIGLYTHKLPPMDDMTTQTAIEIKPHESCLIPLGVKCKFSPNYALVLFNRSGIAAKKHLLRGSCVIDFGYSGEILVNLNNVSAESQYLLPGDKLIQGLLLPISIPTIEEGKVENDTERGTGGFGSTDKK